MLLRHDKNRTYNRIEGNAVGPTTSTSLRTVTAHNDSTSYYIAMNGNDTTGAGTQASPWRTLAKCVTMASKSIYTAIRNGYVGDMIFDAPTESGYSMAFPSGTTVQVELGQVAYIRSTDVVFHRISDGGSVTSITTQKIGSNHRTIVTGLDAGNKISYTDNGYSYTQSTSAAGSWLDSTEALNGRFVAVLSGGSIYYSTNGNTWTSSGVASKSWGRVLTNLLTGRLIAFQETDDYIYYSDDHGSSWTLSNVKKQAAGQIKFCSTKGRFIIYSDSPEAGLFYSDDGLVWIKIQGAPYNGYNNGIVELPNGVLVMSAGYNIYWSSDHGLTWDLVNSWGKSLTFMVVTEWGRIYGPASDLYIYYSDDGGLTWIQTDSLAPGGSYGVMGITYSGALLADYDNDPSGNGFMLGWNAVIVTEDSCEFNGWYIDGNGFVEHGAKYIGTNAAEWFNLKWCEVLNCIGSGIPYHLSIVNIYNSIIQGGYRGIHRVNLPLIHWCLFYGIEKEAVWQYGATLNQKNLTIYDCGTGLYIEQAITTNTNFKNMVFRNCTQNGTSLLTALTLTYSLSDTDLYWSGITLDTATCIIGLKALFQDVLAFDFVLRHLQDGYPVESPGLLAGSDSKDMGAYDVTFTDNTLSWESTTFPEAEIQVTRRPILIRADSGITLGNAFKRITDGRLRQWNIQARPTATTDLLQKIESILLYDDPIQMFPVGEGYLDSTANAAFSWLTPTAQTGLIQAVITNATDIAALDTFFGDDEPAGLFMVAKSIAGAVSPYTEYPFKVHSLTRTTGTTDSITILLENLHNRYPGTGFSNPATGSYAWSVVKAVGVVIGQYVNTNQDGYIQFNVPNLEETWVKNQWSGFWLAIDYQQTIGSRETYRIIANDSNVLYCDNPLDLTPTLVHNNYYHLKIDLVMVKAQPETTESTPTDDKADHNKHGNDWWSTKVTRETNTTNESMGWLAYNETGEQVLLIESEDADGDGL